MRLLLASLALALPGLALAQEPIPQSMLAEHTRSCVAECTQARDEAVCRQVCDCVTREIGDNWTRQEFEDRAARLSGEGGGDVRDELGQIAAYCMQQAGQAQ